jgi:hypothetical protein
MRVARRTPGPRGLASWLAALAALATMCVPEARALPSLERLLGCRALVDPTARLACFDRETAELAAGASAAKSSALPSVATPGAKASAPPSTAALPATTPPLSAPAAASFTAPPSAAAAASNTAPVRTGAAVSTGSAAAASAEATRDFGLPAAAIAAKEVAAGQRPADLPRIHAHVTELSRAGDGRVVFMLDNGQTWLQVLDEGDLLLRPGDAVTISRGLFHSYSLQSPSGRGCKVTRIR